MGISLLSLLSSSFVLNLFWCWSRNKADLTVVPMGHSVEKHINQALKKMSLINNSGMHFNDDSFREHFVLWYKIRFALLFIKRS